jgi:hypothetical protein
MDRPALDFFVKHLKDRRAFPYLQVHYDMHDKGKTKKWDDYAKKIKDSHVVIMICTPNYKEKTINKVDGVWDEYPKIVDKYNEMKAQAKKIVTQRNEKEVTSEGDISNFDLIPVIISGSKDNSIPNIVDKEKIGYYDLSFFNIWSEKEKGKKRIKITDNHKNEYEQEFRNIKSRIYEVKKYYDGGRVENSRKVYDGLKLEKDLFGQTKVEWEIDALFRQTKAEFDRLPPDYHKSLFVKTYSYKQAFEQSRYIFVGRKGSGKSALVQISSIKLAKDFSYVIPIERSIEDLVMQHNLFDDEAISDSLFLSKRSQLFTYTWRLYFRLQVLECIVSQYFSTLKQKKIRNSFANEIENSLIPVFEKISGKNLEDYIKIHSERKERNYYFIYSMRTTINYLKKCIKNARPEEDYFFSDIESAFNYNQLLESTFGNNNSDIIEKIVKCQGKKILVTFDEIDTYKALKNYPDTKENILKFEIDSLYSLVSLVNDYRQIKKGDSLAPFFDFIIAISSEHLFEILKGERDIYRFQEYYSVISWTGIELALMLRKRLSVMSSFQVSKQYKNNENFVVNTLNEVLSEKYKVLPNIIKFTLEDGVKYEMPLFLYILRFTFWRPRDILRYFHKIITRSMDSKGVMNISLNSEDIRQTVKKTTSDLIESDFIEEYCGYISNIQEIVDCFYGCDQLFQFDEIEKRIGDVEMCLTDAGSVDSTICKIKHLYQIGFIGIYANPEVKSKYNLELETAFIFTEGAEVINRLSDYNKKTFTYTIHPIFQSELHINMDKKVLTSNYTWEYLKKMEDLMRTANHSFVVKF